MMERLTRRNECGQALFAKSVNWDEHPIVAVLDKLAEYEDTGLKPQQLNHLKQENAAMKRLLKLAMEDMQYFSRHDFEPAWKCEVCEKFVQSGKRCESMTECNFIWYKLKECELIFKGDKVIAWMPLPEPYEESKSQ